MRAANDVVVCGYDEVAVEGCLGFGHKDVVHGFEAVDVGPVEFVVAVFYFLFFEDVAIRHCVVPLELPDFIHALKVHGNAFEAVGDFDGNGVELHAARLLEIGKLRDFHAV